MITAFSSILYPWTLDIFNKPLVESEQIGNTVLKENTLKCAVENNKHSISSGIGHDFRATLNFQKYSTLNPFRTRGREGRSDSATGSFLTLFSIG